MTIPVFGPGSTISSDWLNYVSNYVYGGSVGSGTVTNVSVATSNGFSGSVASPTTTPVITLTTPLTGLLKGNGTAMSAAVSGTDYAPPTSGTAILYGNGSGGFSSVTVGSGLTFATGTLTATGGGTGTVTDVSVVSANGMGGSVANSTTTPAITLTTSLTGLIKGNGTAFSAATAGTDYSTPTGVESLTQKNMKNFGLTYYDSTTTNALNVSNGPHQRWAPNTGAQTLSLSGWAASGQHSELLIEGVNLGAATITWPTITWMKKDGTFTTTIATYLTDASRTLQASGIDFIFLYTRDGSTTIYGKLL